LIAAPRPRLFLDSNVITAGIVSPWGLDRAVLALCAVRVCRLVLAQAVRDEVEENLLTHAGRLPGALANQIVGEYDRLLALMQAEIVPYPAAKDVGNSRSLIRHLADVPILLSAIACKPDWLLTHNTKHFTPAVAAKTGLRIATPRQFFGTLSKTLAQQRRPLDARPLEE
jgi:predicted nucleic acid-binding protein